MVLSSNKLAYFVTYRLVAELSTPFLNLVFISEQIPDLPQCCHHVAVIIFSIFFVLCRLVPFLPFWRVVSRAAWLAEIPSVPMRYFQLSSAALLDFLNLQWSILIFRRFQKSLVFLKKFKSK